MCNSCRSGPKWRWQILKTAVKGIWRNENRAQPNCLSGKRALGIINVPSETCIMCLSLCFNDQTRFMNLETIYQIMQTNWNMMQLRAERPRIVEKL